MEKVLKVLGIIALIIGLGLLTALPVLLLWNWLMPVLFGLTTITFLQAWGISLLCSVLFKQSSNIINN